MASNVILDLCGGSGNWSKPYKEKGYKVELVTLPDRDIVDYVYPDNEVYGILAAVPCNKLSKLKHDATLNELKYAYTLFGVVMAFVAYYKPRFWAIENPAGSKAKLLLGEPQYRYAQWWFGENTVKWTYIWGRFNKPKRQYYNYPTEIQYIENKSCSKTRAITPSSFARAFYEANQ